MSEVAAPILNIDSAVSEVARLPDQTEEEAYLFIEQLWRFFCSLRLTLVNLLLLFLGMIAGTFVNPANDSLANIEKAFAGHIWTLRAYRWFELYDLFHSWWFTLFMTSMALNLVACSLERLPRIYFLVRYPEKRLDQVKGVRFRASGTKSGEPINELNRIEVVLKARGFKLERIPGDDGSLRLFAEKSRYARFGVWVVHLSLLLVLGGGVFGRLTAFEGTTDVPQGGGEVDSFTVRKPDGSSFKKKMIDTGNGKTFLVRCDDFRLKEFEPGRPKAFESDLKLFEKLPDGSEGKLLAAQTINVNHPLKYGGLTFYQASYRQLDEQQRAKLSMVDKANGEKRDLLVGPGEPVDAADGLRYQLVDYALDFAGQGSAVQVLRTEYKPGSPITADGRPPADAKLSTFWIFSKAPMFDANNREDRFGFAFEKLTVVYATGLQIARDPSTPVIYLGCFLLFAGIGVAFYGAHKRVWAKVDAGRVQLAGASHRNADAFSEEFAALCLALDLEVATSKRAPPAAPVPAA